MINISNINIYILICCPKDQWISEEIDAIEIIKGITMKS